MIVLNEKKYAEECLKNGTISKPPYFTLNILSNYYYHVLGYRYSKILKSLMSFMETNSIDYKKNKLYWNDFIDKIAKKSGKHPIHELDGVWITSKELERIKSLNNKLLEKLAFTLLCLAKYSNSRFEKNNDWVSLDYVEIFKLARITCGKQERYSKINILYKRGFVELAKRIDNLNLKIMYIDKETVDFSTSNGDVFISDFRELGYEYLKYLGENIVSCKKCGVLIRGNKNGTKKYCKECVCYTPKQEKLIVCVDCGKEFLISGSNKRTCRCDNCKKIHRNNYQKAIMRMKYSSNCS